MILFFSFFDFDIGYNSIESPLFSKTTSAILDGVYHYYPYGKLIENRTWEAEDARFGFQGQERDDEIAGAGNSLSTLFRQNSPLYGGWLSIDPLADKYPGISPYVSMGCNPIMMTDILGLSPEEVMNKAYQYIGTPYQYGSKIALFKAGYDPKTRTFSNSDGSITMSESDYNTYVGIPSKAVIYGGHGSALDNQYYKDGVLNKEFGIKGAYVGIDCSGFVFTCFNEDSDKLMPDFISINNTNAKKMYDLFVEAEEKKQAFVSKDFAKISKGDIVFNKSRKHVMIATGNIKYNDKGKVTSIEIIDAPGTGKFVDTHWRKLQKGDIFGHTYRKEPSIPPVSTELGGSPEYQKQRKDNP